MLDQHSPHTSASHSYGNDQRLDFECSLVNPGLEAGHPHYDALPLGKTDPVPTRLLELFVELHSWVVTTDAGAFVDLPVQLRQLGVSIRQSSRSEDRYPRMAMSMSHLARNKGCGPPLVAVDQIVVPRLRRERPAMTTTILGISGSLRRGSLNRSLLRAAAELVPANTQLELADISDLPLYDWDVEQETGFPASVQRFRDQIDAVDAVLIATPEYNNSVPGALKNAIDWASRGGPDSPLTRKPAAIMGAAGRLGSVRAQMHLRTILMHNDLQVVQNPEVLVPGREAFENGELVHERYRDQVRRLLEALVELAS